MKIEITTPEDFMGDVIGDLNSRRGRIDNMEDRDNGVKVITSVLPMSPAAAKDLAFKVRAAVEGSLLCVIGSHENNKPQLSIMMSDDMVSDHGLNAGQMVREAAKLIQGGGGGQPHFAQAGGKNVDGLSAAVDKVIELANL